MRGSGFLIFAALIFFPPLAAAAVPAENHLGDEPNQLNRSLEMQKELQQAAAFENEEAKQELRDLKKLLELPKRDRVRVEVEGQYQFDTNVLRKVPRREKDDSLFDTKPTVLFDLSRRKMDLRFEVNGSKHWSVEFPEGQSWSLEERLRYRRKYLKKISHTIQSRISRNSTFSTQTHKAKVQWNSAQMTAINYPFSPKLSLNVEGTANNHYLTQEVFDQDTSEDFKLSPSGFWNLTPKTRVSFGYGFGGSRVHTKTGNANTHDVRVGYFGKITTKSSASLDLSYTRTTPKSNGTAFSNGLTAGLGYIWQMTGKTQLTAQVTESLQNSTSKVDDAVTPTKSVTYTTNENYALSLNSRLNKKLSSVLNWSMARSFTTTLKNKGREGQTIQWTFPASLTLTYIINRWMTVIAGYTFTYKTGYEKPDRSRDHLWQFSTRLAF